VEYQQIAAAGFLFLPSTDPLLRVSWNGGGGACGLVFGTLLGPEATGPWPGPCYPAVVGCAGRVVGLVCFWFPGCTDHMVWSLCGGSCGVCGTGLLFENYIVDASIFYKKQFPRI
jgi:hypothetical protein